MLTSFVAFPNLTHTINGYTRFLSRPNSTAFWRAGPVSTQCTLPRCIKRAGKREEGMQPHAAVTPVVTSLTGGVAPEGASH